MPSPGTPWPADRAERRAVSALLPYTKNSRTHTPAQIEQIARSIRHFGFTMPVLIAEDDTILAGHARVQAAKKLGMTQVPVVVAHDWSSEQKSAYVLADNKLTLNSDWDIDLLVQELGDLFNSGFDLDLTGFAPAEIELLVHGDEIKLHDAPADDPEPVMAQCPNCGHRFEPKKSKRAK